MMLKGVNQMNSKYDKILYCVYFGIFLILWLLLFWKCKFGFPLDESFYVLFCYRFINGDIPVLHEWNPTQFFTIWIYPFAWIYYKVFGSSEQIILAFRYLFSFVWGITTLFFFYRLRKISFVGAAFSSLVFFVFIPYGEMALYYNTIGLITIISALVIILTAERKKQLQYLISGSLFAVAVTCCPFLFSLYLLLILAVFVSLIKKQKGLFQLFCYLTAGAVPVIIIVYLFYIVPSSFGDVLNGLKHLIADRDHQFTYLGKFSGFFISIYNSNPVVLLVSLIVLATIIVAKRRKTNEIRVIGLFVVCVSVIMLYVIYLKTIDYNTAFFVNRYSFPPIFVGLYCGMLAEEKMARKMFYNMYIPGLIYMFCINISSNVVFEAAMIPSVICTMTSFFLVHSFWKENPVFNDKKLNNNLGKTLISFVFIICFSVGLYALVSYAYINGKMNKLNVKIERGPYKGIYCSQTIRNTYYKLVQDLEPIRNSKSKKVLLLTNFWYYLDIDKKPSCSSCFYLTVDDLFLDQQEEYYQLYPQFIPEVIYVGHNHTDLLERVKSYGYSGEQTELGAYILYRQKS